MKTNSLVMYISALAASACAGPTAPLGHAEFAQRKPPPPEYDPENEGSGHQIDITCWYEVTGPTLASTGYVYVSGDPMPGTRVEHWILPAGWELYDGWPQGPVEFKVKRQGCEKKLSEFMKERWTPDVVTFQAISHVWGPVRATEEPLVGGNGTGPLEIKGCNINDGANSTWGYYRCEYDDHEGVKKAKVELVVPLPTSHNSSPAGCSLAPGHEQVVTFPGKDLACPASGRRWFELHSKRRVDGEPAIEGVLDIELRD